MKIGLVTDFYYPWIGGPATFIRNLGEGLAQRGHVVSLLCPSADGVASSEMDGCIDVRRVRTLPVPFGYELRVSSFPLLDTSRWLHDIEPDIIHIHHPFPLCAAASWLAGRHAIPILATNHTIPECSLWGLRSHRMVYRPVTRVFGMWISWLAKHCTAVATPTQTAAYYLNNLGYDRPVTAISNGVDTARFRPRPKSMELASQLGLDDRPVVLYTGRLDAEKRMDVWLHAAKRISQQMDVQFLIGGQGSERKLLESMVSDLELWDRTHFFGYLSEAAYPEVYALADVFCITSEVELQSIATLEAIASGVPVVAVRAGALPELVHDGENGYLARPGDTHEIARLLQQVLSDHVRRNELARHSRTIAEGHDLRITIEKYEQLLNNHSNPRPIALP